MTAAEPTQTRSPTRALVALCLFTSLAAIWFVSPWFPMQTLAALERASGGWLSVTLIASASIGLVQLAIIRLGGRQRWADIGWRRGLLGPALLATAGLWLVMQLATVLAAAWNGQPLVLRDAWAAGLGLALGPLLAQLLGTALMEESVFRGYLWPQLVRRFSGSLSPRAARWSGLLASQALFGLLHVPIRIYGGASSGEVAGMVLMLFVIGLVFALIYAATGNLFVAVGVHALGNAPTLLFEPHGPAPTMVLLAATLLLSAACWWYRRPVRRRAMAPLAAAG